MCMVQTFFTPFSCDPPYNADNTISLLASLSSQRKQNETIQWDTEIINVQYATVKDAATSCGDGVAVIVIVMQDLLITGK